MRKSSINRKPATIRLEEVVDAGIEVFIQRGYKQTKLIHIGDKIGVSAPALYNYVASKEALFDLCVKRAVFPTVAPSTGIIPVPTPDPAATLNFILQVVDSQPVRSNLHDALEVATVEDATSELSKILGELFDTLSYFRLGIRLLERCALDRPNLHEAWFSGARNEYLDLLSLYFEKRASSKLMRVVPHYRGAAKLCIESIAYFAMHRHHDPRGIDVDNSTAKEIVVDALCAAYVA